MKNSKLKFKKGAASFYIVAFSTLILLIVATSFAAIIISEITRTSNDDLSQSAYDSALAGVEDAKLAYFNYQKCIAENGGGDCANIVGWIESQAEQQSCDMVAKILGRNSTDEEGGVIVLQESNTDVSNNMQQAYTCVKMQTILKDYRSTLSSANQFKVIKTKFDEPGENNVASSVDRIKISWYETAAGNYHYTNINNNGNVVFPRAGEEETAAPPTISVALVQTTENYNLNDFDLTVGDRTDRGMIYLVPSNQVRSGDGEKTYRATSWDGTNKTNIIEKEAFLKSNNKTAVNLPYVVYCDPASTMEFACSATIWLPEPIGGDRNKDTFIFVVGLPYGKPNTDFAMEFLCRSGSVCGTEIINSEGDTEIIDPGQAYLDGVQVRVDSTGRANDLYRRVEVRLESEANSSYLSLMGPLNLIDNTGSGANTLEKKEAVIKEWNF